MDYKEINNLLGKCIRERNNPNATGKELPTYVREELIATLQGEW